MGAPNPLIHDAATPRSAASSAENDLTGRTAHAPGQTPPGQSLAAPQEHEEIIPKDLPKVGGGGVLLALVCFLALLGGLFVLGYSPRKARQAEANADAGEAGADPVVTVMKPRRQTSAVDLELPGDVQPFQTTSIYARANGYLKSQRVDIGDKVETDQLLAEIDTPEIDAQLNQARANAKQAKVNIEKARTDLALAKLTLDRYTDVVKQGAVAKQDVDEKRTQYEQATANVEVMQSAMASEEAEVRRLEVLHGFERVTAPFAGTITARNYDVGALVSPAGVGVARELFQLQRTDTLRVFVNVPQNHATSLKVGDTAQLTVRNYPGRSFEGRIVRTTGAVNASTRTLRVQVDVPNPDGALLAGMYGQIRFRVTVPDPPLVIPISGLIYNAKGLSVATVVDGKARFVPVTVGRDFGNEIEVTTGLAENVLIIANPGERIHDGIAVQARPAKQ